MSKAIQTSAVITSINSKVDKSLSLRIATPELSSIEKTVFLDLQGINVSLLIVPEDGGEMVEVEEKIEGKSHSQRLRGALFVFWKRKYQESYPDFEVFYRTRMDRFIENVKEVIPEA